MTSPQGNIEFCFPRLSMMFHGAKREKRLWYWLCTIYTENQLVDRCSKIRDASNPEGKFPPWCACCIQFHDFFSGRYHQRPYKPKGPELVKTGKWNAHVLFGNFVWEFWSTFQEIPFSRENFCSRRQNESFLYITFHPKFPLFGWMVLKQPLISIDSVVVLLIGQMRISNNQSQTLLGSL